jgi:hypothetical protein
MTLEKPSLSKRKYVARNNSSATNPQLSALHAIPGNAHRMEKVLTVLL